MDATAFAALLLTPQGNPRTLQDCLAGIAPKDATAEDAEKATPGTDRG